MRATHLRRCKPSCTRRFARAPLLEPRWKPTEAPRTHSRRSADKLESCLLTAGVRYALLSAFDKATGSLSAVCADPSVSGADPSLIDQASAVAQLEQLVSQVMAHAQGHDPLHFLSVLAVGTAAGAASRSLVGAVLTHLLSSGPDACRAGARVVNDLPLFRCLCAGSFRSFKTRAQAAAAADAAASACAAAAAVAGDASREQLSSGAARAFAARKTTGSLSVTVGANALQIGVMGAFFSSPELCALPDEERLLLGALISGTATGMFWQPLVKDARKVCEPVFNHHFRDSASSPEDNRFFSRTTAGGDG